MEVDAIKSDLVGLVVVATTIAAVLWFMSPLSGVQRLTSAAIAWVVAFLTALLVGYLADRW
ncbi:hypothetical protein ACKVMT_04950 [Halobacteriales archaeon Cl-PHB]